MTHRFRRHVRGVESVLGEYIALNEGGSCSLP